MYQQLVQSINQLSFKNKCAILKTYYAIATGQKSLLINSPLYRDIDHTLCHLAEQDGIISQCFGCYMKQKTPHRMTWKDGSLYAWCIWDAFFIVQSVGLPARIDTCDAITGDLIGIDYAHNEFVHDSANRIYFAFPLLRDDDDLTNLRACFCCRTHAFVRKQTAIQFASEQQCEVVGWAEMIDRTRQMVAALMSN